jgi:hypothetical protein
MTQPQLFADHPMVPHPCGPHLDLCLHVEGYGGPVSSVCHQPASVHPPIPRRAVSSCPIGSAAGPNPEVVP